MLPDGVAGLIFTEPRVGFRQSGGLPRGVPDAALTKKDDGLPKEGTVGGDSEYAITRQRRIAVASGLRAVSELQAENGAQRL